MTGFDASLWVGPLRHAEFFATDLFDEGFRAAFPVPRDNCGLSIPTPPSNWRQYCALYKWPNGRIETVGFCNWIRHDDVYLLGGIVARRNFYRRLPADHWARCRERGGVAQILAETGAAELTDCSAWFGYTGDRKSSLLSLRVDFQPTPHRYLIVKWFATLAPDAQARLFDRIAAIGPF
ncbi:MAG: hypothetical protein ABI886_12950 [Betaproteobacteria bacterium]